MLHDRQTLNARGKLLDISSPVVMGILNVTPDSFYDGGLHVSIDAAIQHTARMLDEGATVIDVGGMSSRPGSEIITPQEEVDRIGPFLDALCAAYPEAIFSIDTIHSATAREAIDRGASIINDISGGRFDPEILTVAGEMKTPYVCMHMQGIPKSMQVEPHYDDVVHDVLQYFVERVAAIKAAGVNDIILDPGFGFGKTDMHNYQLLKKLKVMGILEFPVLVGISRKSMICRVLGVSPKDALNGTTALHMLALQNGARILRVHDVKQARESIALHEFYKDCDTPEGQGMSNGKP